MFVLKTVHQAGSVRKSKIIGLQASANSRYLLKAVLKRQQLLNGPVTLLRIVLAYTNVCEIPLVRCYTLTYARGTLDIGCIRFKYGRIRCYTLRHTLRVR